MMQITTMIGCSIFFFFMQGFGSLDNSGRIGTFAGLQTSEEATLASLGKSLAFAFDHCLTAIA